MEIETVLAAEDPLGDSAFRTALSDTEFFRQVAEGIMRSPLSDGLININGEISVAVNGKSIRLDVLGKSVNEFSSFRTGSNFREYISRQFA